MKRVSFVGVVTAAAVAVASTIAAGQGASAEALLAGARKAVGVPSSRRPQSVVLVGRETRPGSADESTVTFEYHRQGWYRRTIVSHTMGGRLRSVAEAVLTPTGPWSRIQSIDVKPEAGGQRVLRTDVSDYGPEAAAARRNLLAERERLAILLLVDVPAAARVTRATNGDAPSVTIDGAAQPMVLGFDGASGRPRLLQYGEPTAPGASPELRWNWEVADFRKVDGDLWLPHTIDMTTQAGRKHLEVQSYRLGAVDPTTFVKPPS